MHGKFPVLRRLLEACEETLALYDVLERDDWQQGEAWQLLTAEERHTLGEAVRELLLLLAWARRRFDVDFVTTQGLMHVAQPEETVKRLGHALETLDPFRLAGMSPLIRIGGSLVAALAVLESLAQGVPQVAIPVTYDQPGVAARIAEKQTGVVTSLDKLTADHLSTLLDEVLSNPTYRDNARKLQKAIAEANGLSVAADLVVQSLEATTVSAASGARVPFS